MKNIIQILEEINAIIKHRNYSKLIKPRKNNAGVYLIKAGKDYDIYGSLGRTELYYLSINSQLFQLA